MCESKIYIFATAQTKKKAASQAQFFMHNLTGKTQPNGAAETTVSKLYHEQQHVKKCFQLLTPRFFTPNIVFVKMFGLTYKFNNQTKEVFYNELKQGTYCFHGSMLAYTETPAKPSENFSTDETILIPLSEITVFSPQK